MKGRTGADTTGEVVRFSVTPFNTENRRQSEHPATWRVFEPGLLEYGEALRLQLKLVLKVDLDLAMPVMDGGECFQRLQRIDPAVPVLICSGNPSDAQSEQLLAAWAVDAMDRGERVGPDPNNFDF